MTDFKTFVMSRVAAETKFPLRSPYEDILRVDHAADFTFDWLNGPYLEPLLESENDAQRYKGLADSVIDLFHERIEVMHGRGDPIESLPGRILEDMEFILHTRQMCPEVGYYMAKNFSDALFAIAALTLPTQKDLATFLGLITNQGDRYFLIEIFVRSFCPGWQFVPQRLANKIGVKHHNSSKRPIGSALMLDRGKRADAIHMYLVAWEKNFKVSRPFMWKPWNEVFSPGKTQYGNACHAFAFEAALAVCAYDIDDSSFRDHPRYPRDLVDYYVGNLRHTRDAARPLGVGANVPIQLPETEKINLAKSKSKSFKRWAELVTDGDADAVSAILDECGRIRKIKNPVKLAGVLSLNDGGVFSDFKDDFALEASLQFELKKRGLKNYEAPEMREGPGRCQRILFDVQKWLQDKNYSLFVLTIDEWGAVLVQDEFKNEFLEISNTLGLEFREVTMS